MVENDEVEVADDCTGWVDDEFTVSTERTDLLDDVDVLLDAVGRAPGPRLSTSHLHLKNSPKIELYGFCKPCKTGYYLTHFPFLQIS